MYRPRTAQYMGPMFPMHPAQQSQSGWPRAAAAMSHSGYPGYMNHPMAQFSAYGTMNEAAAAANYQSYLSGSAMSGNAFSYGQMPRNMVSVGGMASGQMPFSQMSMHNASQHAAAAGREQIRAAQTQNHKKAQSMDSCPYGYPPRADSQTHVSPPYPHTISASHTRTQGPSSAFIPETVCNQNTVNCPETYNGYPTYSLQSATWSNSNQSYDHSPRTSTACQMGYSKRYQSDYCSSPLNSGSPFSHANFKSSTSSGSHSKSSVQSRTQTRGRSPVRKPPDIPPNPAQKTVPSPSPPKQSCSKQLPQQRYPRPPSNIPAKGPVPGMPPAVARTPPTIPRTPPTIPRTPPTFQEHRPQFQEHHLQA